MKNKIIITFSFFLVFVFISHGFSKKYLDFSNNIETNKVLNDSLEFFKLFDLAIKYIEEEEYELYDDVCLEIEEKYRKNESAK